ncbi:hypothetical protein ACS0TY_005935 [Phlomoides rotata]
MLLFCSCGLFIFHSPSATSLNIFYFHSLWTFRISFHGLKFWNCFSELNFEIYRLITYKLLFRRSLCFVLYYYLVYVE